MSEGQPNNLAFDYSKSGITTDQILVFQEKINQYHSTFFGQNEDMIGWIDSPQIWQEKIGEITYLAEKIKAQSQAVVILGIGGSYLGAKAVIEALNPTLENSPEIYFAGNNFSSSQILNIVKKIQDKNFSLIVISKSGSTLETALAFRIFRKIIWDKYGEQSNQRIVAITDPDEGILHDTATYNGYELLPVPKNIGGRYSVLSPVGLLPIAVAGIDIKQLLTGAIEAKEKLSNSQLSGNIAYQYAVARNLFYQQGKLIELWANYNPDLSHFMEWLKQLFGESEGKDGKGIFPASVNFTTDLHSLGQYIQEGPRHLFETVFYIKKEPQAIQIADYDVEDGLSYLNGKTISEVNEKAFLGTIQAHVDGGTPNLIFELEDLSAQSFGELIFTFELACAMSARLLGVNPFNQPGVETYKKNMFGLLGRP